MTNNQIYQYAKEAVRAYINDKLNGSMFFDENSNEVYYYPRNGNECIVITIVDNGNDKLFWIEYRKRFTEPFVDSEIE